MFKFITKRITKQQRSNLIALFVSLAILGTIAAKDQARCWANDTHSFEIRGQRYNAVGKMFSKISRACDAGQLQLLTPPAELSPMLYNSQVAPQRNYVRTGASAGR